MNLVFHIGYHKTGTSWLQQVYFPAHPGIHSICDSRKPWDDEFLQALIGASDRKFNAAKCQDLLLNRVNDIQVEQDKSVILVSAERLSGHPFSGGHDSLRIAERIYACAPEARIFCVVRNQLDMISSIYKQLIAEGLPGRLDDLLHAQHWKGVGFDVGFYEYDLMVEKYHSVFGVEHCRIIPYEFMCSDLTGYLKCLCEFFRIAEMMQPKTEDIVNKSLPSRGLDAFRRLNYFRRSELNPFPMFTLNNQLYTSLTRVLGFVYGALPGRRSFLNDQQQAWIKEYYRASNSRLNTMLGFDVGYPADS